MRVVKLLVLLPVALLLLTPVHATTPTRVTGTFFPNGPGSETKVRTAGDNMFAHVTQPYTFTGDIQGVGVVSESAALHNSTGRIFFKGQIAFTGTVMGSQPGSMDILFEVKAIVPAGGSAGSFQGNLVLGDGTNGLAGLHGEGTLQGENGHGTLSVLVHFDPA